MSTPESEALRARWREFREEFSLPLLFLREVVRENPAQAAANLAVTAAVIALIIW